MIKLGNHVDFIKRRVLFLVLLALLLSVVLGVFSYYPISSAESFTRTVIADSFILTGQETYRQGLGGFHENENITLTVSSNASFPIGFELVTYTGQLYKTEIKELNYSFTTKADYYDAVFTAAPITKTYANSTLVTLQVLAQTKEASYPLIWLAAPAKALFFASWTAFMLILLKPEIRSSLKSPRQPPMKASLNLMGDKVLLSLIVVSLVFWLALVAVNNYPLGTFENWYTDSARHPYSATLFTKVGFSVFDVPLGQISTSDSSFYKYVTWPEMPHLYPLGSILLFLPFSAMLESGMPQTLVLKLEVVLFLVASHVCLFYFLKRFWNQEMNSVLKTVSGYFFYVVLVLYSANGQFDAVSFLFVFFGLILFSAARYDTFLLLVAVATTFKYQSGIFLAPLVVVGLLRLFRSNNLSEILKNKAIIAAGGLVLFDLFTAFLSLPYLTNTRPELIMNAVNAFSPNSQLNWELHLLIILLFVTVTLIFAVYEMNKSRIISLFAVFSLLPCLTMPYFQPWYLPLFFGYLLIPQNKRSLQVAVLWVIFVSVVLSFGGLSFNPVLILDKIRKALTFSP